MDGLKKFLSSETLHGIAALASLVYFSIVVYDKLLNIRRNKMELEKNEPK